MSGKSINFDDKIIIKSNFYKNKKLLGIDNIDVNKTVIPKQESYGKKGSSKYFIGYDNNDDFRSLYIKLPQMTGYAKYFDSNKTMSFIVIDKKLIKKYIKIWERVSSFMNIEFDSEPVYDDNDKYIKIKIKSYGDKVNTNDQGNKISKENASYKCLSLIMLDSVIRVNKKYCPQTLLEEYKYIIKKNKMENLISDDLDLSSSDNESDNESNDGSDNDESND